MLENPDEPISDPESIRSEENDAGLVLQMLGLVVILIVPSVFVIGWILVRQFLDCETLSRQVQHLRLLPCRSA